MNETYYIGKNKNGVQVVTCKLTECCMNAIDDISRHGWTQSPLCMETNPFYINDTFEGKAKCDPEDTFDEEKGRRIARGRAMAKMMKAKAVVFRDYMRTTEYQKQRLFEAITYEMDKSIRFVEHSKESIKAILDR